MVGNGFVTPTPTATATSISTKTMTTTNFNVKDYCGVNSSEIYEFRRNCYLKAAKAGEINILKYLNSEFPELKNERDDRGYTALTLAAFFADKDTVKFLIEEIGMNPTETGFDGRNCFLNAAYGGKIETLEYLNSNFAALKNARDDQQSTALTLAAYAADKDTVQFLIEEVGMSAEETGNAGRNPFLSAAVSPTSVG